MTLIYLHWKLEGSLISRINSPDDFITETLFWRSYLGFRGLPSTPSISFSSFLSRVNESMNHWSITKFESIGIHINSLPPAIQAQGLSILWIEMIRQWTRRYEWMRLIDSFIPSFSWSHTVYTTVLCNNKQAEEKMNGWPDRIGQTNGGQSIIKNYVSSAFEAYLL